MKAVTLAQRPPNPQTLQVLQKLSDTKTTDGKSTLLHYLARLLYG